MRVLFADWEWSGEVHRDRLERLFGSDMPRGISYARCARPMVAEADRLRRVAAEKQAQYLICDSVAFATGGAPESAEMAQAYFAAVRQIGLPSLHIAHVTKSRPDDDASAVKTPFGSVFWSNSVRAAWWVQRVEDDEALGDSSRLLLSLRNTKTNAGARGALVGIEVAFDGERTTIQQVDASGVPGLARKLPLSRRNVDALRNGPLSIVELAHELDAKADSIEKSLKRCGTLFTRLDRTDDGIHRWSLAERRPQGAGRGGGDWRVNAVVHEVRALR